MERKTEYQKLVVTGLNIITAELHLMLVDDPNIGAVPKTVIGYMNDLFNEKCKSFCCDDEDET